MHEIRKLLMALAALGALAFGGAAIANATSSGNSSSDQETNDDGADVSLLHTTDGDRAGRAAVDALAADKLVSVERTDEDGFAYYEVKALKGGKTIEAQVDKSFTVTGQKVDDDQGEQPAQDEQSGD